MNALSVRLPGRLKSSVTPRVYAHRSRSREMNSLPWSTWIDAGYRLTFTARPAGVKQGSPTA
jgi:hypothetical protein